MNKKNVEHCATVIFEVTGNIINDKVCINIDSMPNINLIEKKIIVYCGKDNGLINFFFERIPEEKIKCLYTKLPKNVLDNIIMMTKQIKKYILNLLYNNWHRYFIDILTRIKDDYELYSVWTNDYDHNIFSNLEDKIKEVNNKFKDILLSLNK
jgi:hypothetical protein